MATGAKVNTRSSSSGTPGPGVDSSKHAQQQASHRANRLREQPRALARLVARVLRGHVARDEEL
eukprot:4797995-Prymnesium_polylepis.1